MNSSRPYFEEVQSLRETRWIWYVLALLFLFTFGPVLNMLYWQLILGEPFGDRPMSDTGLIIFSFFVIASGSVAAWVLLSMKLETYVNPEGVHYKFSPLSSRWKLIQKAAITGYEVRGKRNFLEGRIGYHKNFFRRTTSMAIRGGRHVRLLLDDRSKWLIGTQHPEDFERALKRLMMKDQRV